MDFTPVRYTHGYMHLWPADELGMCFVMSQRAPTPGKMTILAARGLLPLTLPTCKHAEGSRRNQFWREANDDSDFLLGGCKQRAKSQKKLVVINKSLGHIGQYPDLHSSGCVCQLPPADKTFSPSLPPRLNNSSLSPSAQEITELPYRSDRKLTGWGRGGSAATQPAVFLAVV